VIRYGKMLKGLTFAVPFMIAPAIVFSVAQGIVRGIAPV
jgi:hypothetical protein